MTAEAAIAQPPTNSPTPVGTPTGYPSARRNWTFHALEGALFMGSLALVESQTLLPALVDLLGGPTWLVGLMPVMGQLGFALPTLVTAHYVATLGRFHPILLWTGIPMRLPYLAAAMILLWFGDSPTLCLLAVVLAPLLLGLCGGVNATAWPQLLARTVPPERRASLFATRFSLSAGIGIAAGGVVAWMLATFPGTAGYGGLHLTAFAGLMLSYALFALIREPPWEQPRDPETGLAENLRRFPELIRADPHLRAYLGTTACFALTGIAAPYLGIQAVATAGGDHALLGTVISWQMGGAVAGGLLAGAAGDRWGGRVVLIGSRLGSLAVFLAAPWLSALHGWCLLFAVFGAATSANGIATGALQLDVLPGTGRANRLAIMTLALLPVSLLAGGGGGWLRDSLGAQGFTVLSLAAAVLCGASLLILIRWAGPQHTRT